MKVLIASDIHGNSDKFKIVYDFFNSEQCDKMIILGDIFSNYFGVSVDSKLISDYLWQIPSKVVTIMGNCDSSYDVNLLPTGFVMSHEEVIGYNRYVFFHGHRKTFAPSANCFVQGHTHVYKLKKVDNNIYINPGSVSRPRDGSCGTFGVISEKNITIFDLNLNIKEEIFL